MELQFWYTRALFDYGQREAVAAAREAADRYAKARYPHLEAVTRALLSRAEARRNDTAAARLELARADELADRCGLPYPRLSVALPGGDRPAARRAEARARCCGENGLPPDCLRGVARAAGIVTCTNRP